MSSLVILGAGGHGAVVAEAAYQSGVWESVKFLDDSRAAEKSVVGFDVLGDFSCVESLVSNDSEYLVAIGDNKIRQELMSFLERAGAKLATVIHPNAVVSPSATISGGSVVFAGTVINARSLVGRGTIINTGSVVDHDCKIGDCVHVSPGAHLAGNVSVGDRSWIGIASAVKEGITVGKDCVVGAGAAVVSNIDSGLTVVGVPAKTIERS